MAHPETSHCTPGEEGNRSRHPGRHTLPTLLWARGDAGVGKGEWEEAHWGRSKRRKEKWQGGHKRERKTRSTGWSRCVFGWSGVVQAVQAATWEGRVVSRRRRARSWESRRGL